MAHPATIAAAVGVVVLGGFAGPKDLPPPYQKVYQVANATDLSQAEKVARLKEMIAAQETRQPALYALDRLDRPAATEAAVAAFRAKDASREQKLRLGHFVLQVNRPQSDGYPQAFLKEFAAYLVQAVLDGGNAEFCRKLPDGTITAVGEYAYLASGFSGYPDVDFAPFKDPRVVPVLIRCLEAPDNVWPKDQGDFIRGKPGEPTGRNTARQQIPVALARLGDARAVEPLKTVLFKHEDIYGRMNAAYALAKLVKEKEDRVAIGKEVLARPELLWCCLPFGKGLIEAGDDAGLEFLAIGHAGGYGRLEYPREILYMMNQRLAVLKGFKSPKVEGFLREALACKPLRGLLLFEPGSAKIDGTYVTPPKDDAEALEVFTPGILQTYAAMLECTETNNLKSLAGPLAEIAAKSRNEKIRQMTEAALKTLEAGPAEVAKPNP